MSRNPCQEKHIWEVAGVSMSSVTREHFFLDLECRDCKKKLELLILVKDLLKADQEAKKSFLDILSVIEKGG